MENESRWTQQRLTEVLNSGHWLGSYISSMLEEHETNGLTFHQANELLATEKREFDRDLDVARRMYRVYGDLVVEASPSDSTTPEPSFGR